MRRHPQQKENFIPWLIGNIIGLVFCFFATFLITAPLYVIVSAWYFLKQSVQAPEETTAKNKKGFWISQPDLMMQKIEENKKIMSS